jgi:asparagine synthase (glutamine-hydrolysing)
MCGICGQYNFSSNEPVNVGSLRKMNDTLRHRGPNDEGYYLRGQVGLAMRRLSIIDLAGGKQPIHNELKDIWIVLNGEIFNYPDLRGLLAKKGHRFYTASDTETIVHLYEEYGEDCVQHLRGMFAFAIWDERRQTLFIARDRLGIKPLFYSEVNNEQLFFASEPKALLTCPQVPRELDFQAMDAFFAYGYIPAPLCIYNGIRKLPPAHWLRVDAQGLTIRKYWDLHFQPDYGKSEAYFIQKFDEIFADAVRMRMLSEVPLGAFLSGGVDSSLVVAQMAQSLNEPVHTFTVGFSGDTGGYLDERPYARLIAERYGCTHREIMVHPSVEDILGPIVTAFDEPFADDSVIPSYYICRSSKEAVTVALTGLGGDELFAGYERYLGFRLSQICDRIPKFLSNRILSPAIEALPELKDGHYAINHLKRFIRAADLPADRRYASYVTMAGPELRARLFSRESSTNIDFDATLQIMLDCYASANTDDPIDRALYQDIKTYLPDDILALTDRIGMLHSQELRVPFTDHVLMEFCATIPSSLKLRHFHKKHLLKKAAQRLVPREILTHRKQGFASPMAQWLKGDLKSLCGKILSSRAISQTGIFQPRFVEEILNKHLERRELYDRLIFSLIMFQLWFQTAAGSRRDSPQDCHEF